MEQMTTGFLTTDKDDLTSIEEAITTATESKIESTFQPRNRAERRALMKRQGKKGRQQIDAISSTAKKLNYIKMIQRLRELNEKETNYEATED